MPDNKYRFVLDNFDGPLDLLLFLIKDKKIDIIDINILNLAEQYLEFISNIDSSNFEIASEYLLMSATLIKLKSQSILDTTEDKEVFEIDKIKLLKQLAEYQKFKILKEILRKKEIKRKKIFIKTPDNLEKFIRKEDPAKLDGHSDPVKLIMILRKMFERTYAQKISVSTIDTFNLSTDERADEIILMFKDKKELKFNKVFDVPSIKHFLVTLLALLDLSRRQFVILKQDKEFGVIKILKGDHYG